ncbi:hypothetical protein BKA56DRAFT_611282 [Ilyonectria sp. MPI-CAGE-AT-0026]|nr:hypothetical protein BKA56DRAFT_611282 [Ilyonectria sp. MPI-CAGE-AT-0026]
MNFQPRPLSSFINQYRGLAPSSTAPPAPPSWNIAVMSSSTNLTPGAVYEGHKHLPPIIPSHTLPKIEPDSIIIGACGVRIQECLDDNWLLSDFCAFNFLLKGLGKKQTWLSAVSEQDLIDVLAKNPELSPGFWHGNPCMDRKIVFDCRLVDQKELTLFSVCQSSELVSTLVTEVQAACALAANKYQFNEESLLRIDKLQAAIDPRANITLTTTACYSGGWAICPDLNKPTLRRFMQTNATMMANSCPGDWNIAPNRRLQGHLRADAAGEERGIRQEDHLVNVMLYRLELAAFVDGVVDQFRLVRPFGQSLLYWDRLRWHDQHRRDEENRTDIYKAMGAQQLVFHEDASGSQDWGFGRSHQYLAAAIFESSLDSQAIMRVTEEIGALFKESARHARENPQT